MSSLYAPVPLFSQFSLFLASILFFSPLPLLCPLSHSLLSVLNFYLDSRWGLHADRLVVSKEQRCARSVPGLSLLQAADHALTSCHLTSDLLVGDVAITQGRHYWACSVEPGSYLVKASEFMCTHFNNHWLLLIFAFFSAKCLCSVFLPSAPHRPPTVDKVLAHRV